MTSAPPAEEKPSEQAPEEAEGAAVVPETVPPIQIPPKVLEQAAALGIDLKQIVDWAKSMEDFKNVAMQNFEIIQKSFNELKPLIKLSKQAAQAQAAPSGQAPTGALGGLQALAPFLQMFSGGGGNALGDEVTKQIIQSGLNQMNAGTKLLEAIQTRIMAKVGAKAVEEAME